MAMTKVRPGRATMSLFRTRGRPAASAASNGGPRRDTAVIDWAAYIDGNRVSTETVADAVRLIRDGRLTADGDSAGFVWVGLHEPSAAELAELAAVFGLPPLAVEDAIHA
ncbi:MAG: magnesium transporter CorA, partial [Actinomadura rubrobrunea]|nr:magnesium transporter CorA [Actinomadura rubrobrunea]